MNTPKKRPLWLGPINLALNTPSFKKVLLYVGLKS